LYYVASRWQGAFPRNEEVTGLHAVPAEQQCVHGVVWRLQPETGERPEVAVLARPNAYFATNWRSGAAGLR
jgi:hypothetical protein